MASGKVSHQGGSGRGSGGGGGGGRGQEREGPAKAALSLCPASRPESAIWVQRPDAALPRIPFRGGGLGERNSGGCRDSGASESWGVGERRFRGEGRWDTRLGPGPDSPEPSASRPGARGRECCPRGAARVPGGLPPAPPTRGRSKEWAQGAVGRPGSGIGGGGLPARLPVQVGAGRKAGASVGTFSEVLRAGWKTA